MPSSDRQVGLFELPEDAGAVRVCWSYGMGADSTAGLPRTLVDPACRPPQLLPDLSNLIVMIAQTGDVLSPVWLCCSTRPDV